MSDKSIQVEKACRVGMKMNKTIYLQFLVLDEHTVHLCDGPLGIFIPLEVYKAITLRDTVLINSNLHTQKMIVSKIPQNARDF